MLEVGGMDLGEMDLHSGEDLDVRRRMVCQEAYLNLRELERRRCEEDFSFFARQAWHILEPGTEYVHGPHIEAIIDHLCACMPRLIPGTSLMAAHWIPGYITKLLINMPFRHMKSTLLTLWSAWIWTTRPEFRFLFSSYSLGLAIRDTMRMRQITMSSWYMGLWGNKFRLLADQNRKDRFYNTAQGYRMVASLDSGATGEGGDAVIVDDPHNVRDADSELQRNATKQWWFETMGSRKNNPDLSFFVVCGQRVHKYDLSAECKEKGYTVLELPARYEPARSCATVIGWRDWRSVEGELLWPQRFTEESMKDTETTLGPYGTACQLQQNPQLRGGAYIKRDWFKKVSAEYMRTVHGSIVWVRSWDLALTKGGNRTASVEMGQDADGNTYARRGLFWAKDWVDSLPRIEAVGKWEKNQVIVEAIGTTRSAGLEVANVLRGHCMVTVIEDKRNKVSETIPWVAAAQAGQIFLVEEEPEVCPGDDALGALLDPMCDSAPRDYKVWPFAPYNTSGWIEHFLNQFAAWVPDPFLSQEDDETDVMSMCWAASRSMVPLDQGLASGVEVGSRYGNMRGFR